MSETQVLLAKISALRQRLDQAAGLANEARSAAAALLQARPGALDMQVAAASAHDARLDAVVAAVTGPVAQGDREPPRQLTSRARRVLERGRELLTQLRALADDFAPPEGARHGSPEPLALLYRETVALIDTALRTVALLPTSTSAQLHLCQGLEVTLEVVSGRLRTLTAGTVRQKAEAERVARLGELLEALTAGRPVELAPFRALAEEVIAEARACAPLRFPDAEVEGHARQVACHSLTVARVAARVVRHDAELRERQADAVLAALLHDAGMLRVPAEALAGAGPLDDEQRRAVEGHCRAGAELLAALAPEAPWLAEAAGGHHERLDGTGYPDGLRDGHVPALTRLVAVCDVYAALCSARAYRPARAARTALADTLLLADQGQLDRRHAECLLHLSFYPVGSMVELAHGAVGVVVATPGPGHDLSSPARPVVALLTDEQDEPLPAPHHLDLGQSDSHSIVRSLGAAERRALALRFPEWAA
jgi:HD-GYP domain-containing protein (c-di-GMP phosphodiesterase class II)